MYEIFSGGKAPYETIENAEVSEFLSSGRRLESPEETPEEVYSIMMSCWEAEPELRPSFQSLVEKFHEILSRETQEYGYLE